MYKIYKTFKGKVLTPEQVTQDCWIDIGSPTEKDLLDLKSIIDIPEDIVTAIRDIDEVPKAEKHDDFNFILIQTPIATREGEGDDEMMTYSVAPLGILYTADHIVTISEGRNDVVRYLRGKLENYPKNQIVKTDNIPQMILKLVLFTSKMYLRYLKMINHKIHAAQASLEESPENQEVITLMNLEKSLVYFSTSINSNHIVFEKLAKRKYFTSNEDDEELIEDVLDENKQALETVKIYSKIVGNISNTYAAIISNNLNKTVKLLTSMTIILTIPVLIASIFGMNVDLPFQQSPHAFYIVIGASILISLLGVFIFFRKKLF